MDAGSTITNGFGNGAHGTDSAMNTLVSRGSTVLVGNRGLQSGMISGNHLGGIFKNMAGASIIKEHS
jgi:hypothetical protein